HSLFSSLFFFTRPASTDIYTLSLHDALPISARWKITSGLAWRVTAVIAAGSVTGIWCSVARGSSRAACPLDRSSRTVTWSPRVRDRKRHTSELQSPDHLVCRLLLEKKKKNNK